MLALLLASPALGQPWVTPTRTPTKAPTRTPFPVATPTPIAVLPTPTPTPLAPGLTPTPAAPRISVTVCAEVMPIEIQLNWVEAGAITWRRNKEQARRIQPSKAGVWVYSESRTPALPALGDEAPLCVGARCVAISIPTPTIRQVPSNAARPLTTH